MYVCMLPLHNLVCAEPDYGSGRAAVNRWPTMPDFFRPEVMPIYVRQGDYVFAFSGGFRWGRTRPPFAIPTCVLFKSAQLYYCIR